MRLTVVIPILDGKPPIETLETLARQSWNNFRIVIQPDYFKHNASWARNEGFKAVNTELVLFSDDDILWKPDALESMVRALDAHPEAAYSYGGYRMIEHETVWCEREFNPVQLRCNNYISTMSVLRTNCFPGFDESLLRYQDWDLWLRLLDMGKIGVYCGKRIFDTHVRNGITFGMSQADNVHWYNLVKNKYGCLAMLQFVGEFLREGFGE